MPELTKGSTVTNGHRAYTVARVATSKEYLGEKLYHFHGIQGIVFGPWTIEDIYNAGYELAV